MPLARQLSRNPIEAGKQARQRRDLARKDVANYLDPSLRRIYRKICVGNSFEMVAREFHRRPACGHYQTRGVLVRCGGFDRADGTAIVAADLIGSLTPVVCEHMAAIIEPAKIGALLRSIEVYRGPP